MIGLEINDAVIVEQKRVLEQALSTNPKTQKALQKLIRQVIIEAREKVVGNIKFDNGDPRQTARAVRTSVYRKILGANINVYNGRKAHGSNNYEAPRTLRHGQRGGNRVPRGRNTERMLRYAPNDRQMILRWVNSGTGERTAGTRGGRIGGNRGSIAARNFFSRTGDRALVQAADKLATLIDTELMNILNKTK